MHVKTWHTCRICGSAQLTPVLDLGPQFLSTVTMTAANSNKIPRRRVPLELVRCNPMLDENACGLVQLRHSYPGELMFSEYWYRSGVNKTMTDALTDVVSGVVKLARPKEGDIFVDIGCNDGTLLNTPSIGKMEQIGFDPARNIAEGVSESFERVVEFFSAPAYFARKRRKAKIITSIAMFYDLDDPNGFVSDISSVLDDEDGVWVLQFADLPTMLRKTMFDNLIHEHLEYYHLAPVEFLLKRHGLKIVDVERNDVNGGSYRVYAKKQKGASASPEAYERLMSVRREEFDLGLDTDEPYTAFKSKTERIKKDLLQFIRQVNEEGKKIIAYGASTKGNTILQYCGLTEKDIPFVADRNPLKWGGRTVGSGIPIISEEEARAMRPDYFLVLPYYFLEEMRQREKEYLQGEGKFVIPVPSVQVIDG